MNELNEKEKTTLYVKMDRKLREQLQVYADRNDEGKASVSARRAIGQFLNENK